MVKNLNYLALFVFALLCFALPSYANSNASFTLKEITHSPKKTIAYVTFETGVKSKAYIMYGTSSGRLNTRGPNETSFKYNTHRQVIRGLQPGETYYYRIFVTNQNGNTRESVIKSFTMAGEKSSFSVASAKSLVTAAVANLFSGSTIGITSVDPSPPAADWPANANGDLPLAGVFYGNPMTGVGLQNAGIGIETSRRFRAERSGTLAYTSYNNRTLNMFNITDRCKRIGGIWCECVNNNLDQYTCGYLLGSSYSVGNGGNIHVELRTNTAKGTPSNVVLGRTESFIPMDNAKVGYPKLKFTTQPTIQEGVIYHLVYVNKSPPLGACTKLVRLTPSEAKQCSKSRGAQGLNGPRYLSNPWRTGTPTTTGARGPYFGDNSAATFYRRKQESGWSFYKDNISWFDVIYNDGVRVGDAYYPIYITRYRNSVGGGNQVRQKFTVQDATRSVDGVWLNFGHTKTADGSPIQVTLKNGSGTVLATNRLNASQQCIKTVREDKLELAGWCLDWGYSSFGKNVSLVKGSTYSVELSAGGNAGFLFGATGMVPAWTNRNTWIKSGAQFSKNNGSSWSNWNGQSGGADAERDLTLLFTIEGMPKQIK